MYRNSVGDCLAKDYSVGSTTYLNRAFKDTYAAFSPSETLFAPEFTTAWAAQVARRLGFVLAGPESPSMGSRDNHAAVVGIPQELPRWIAAGMFNVAPGYTGTTQDYLDLQYCSIGGRMAYGYFHDLYAKQHPPAPPVVVAPPPPPATPMPPVVVTPPAPVPVSHFDSKALKDRVNQLADYMKDELGKLIDSQSI